nr:immunoglobulin heavy chain junction region [Mus musculus]MBK4188517.1 immunoglobulin heavy chain junction region [Mus musculus]
CARATNWDEGNYW